MELYSMTSEKKPTKPRASRPKPVESAEIVIFSTDGPNRSAIEITIEALRRDDRLDDVDAARLQIVRGLASAVDAQPDNPVIWREYRAAEQALRKETEAHGDPFDKLIAEISAEMGNEKKQKTTNSRT
jgi:hypothetical protein